MTILATILISCTLAACGFAQVTFNGACPDLKGVKNFSTAKFAGKWYEARRFYSKMEDDSKCNSALYSTTDSDHIMNVKYHLIYRESNEHLKMKVKLALTDPSIGRYIKIEENITERVLDTDYDNYAIVWNCKGASQSHTENAFILMRTRRPSKKVIAKALRSFKSLGLDRSKLIASDQTDC